MTTKTELFNRVQLRLKKVFIKTWNEDIHLQEQSIFEISQLQKIDEKDTLSVMIKTIVSYVVSVPEDDVLEFDDNNETLTQKRYQKLFDIKDDYEKLKAQPMRVITELFTAISEFNNEEFDDDELGK